MSPETMSRFNEIYKQLRENPPGPPDVDPFKVIDYLDLIKPSPEQASS